MDTYQIISNAFQRTVENIANSVDSLAGSIEQAGQVMTNSLLQDGKIVALGNGADSALAQLFVSNLLSTHENERPALPALALSNDYTSISAIAASGDINDIYARQLRALGQAGDVLLCINSASSAGNLAPALLSAKERNMRIILLSNSLDEELGALIQDEDVAIYIDSLHAPRTVELQLMTLHCFCTLIDRGIFGTYSQE
jgi:phosphoheptose isomerase